MCDCEKNEIFNILAVLAVKSMAFDASRKIDLCHYPQ